MFSIRNGFRLCAGQDSGEILHMGKYAGVYKKRTRGLSVLEAVIISNFDPNLFFHDSYQNIPLSLMDWLLIARRCRG